MTPVRPKKAKLLLSARDAGSLGHVHAILEEAVRHPWLEVCVYADDPAFEDLRLAYPFVRRFARKATATPSPEYLAALVAEARGIVQAEQPDAVLVGASHCHEVGVDEAILAAASDRPRFAMQDFWGDANLNLGVAPDLYFALDEVAVRLTASRHGQAAMACGSPKHSRYAALDVRSLRERARAALGVSPTRAVVGYFGQSLAHLPGYDPTMRAFGEAMAATAPDAFVFYKPHPRESADEARHTLACLAAAGVTARQVPEGATEQWLAAADVVVSCFSSCAYDAAFLNRSSPTPVGSALYLLFEESIADYFRLVSGVDAPPPSELGLVHCVTRASALRPALAKALSEERKAETWRLAHEHLPDPRNAAREILAQIARRLRLAGTASWLPSAAGALSDD
jgi:hypothetical protein